MHKVFPNCPFDTSCANFFLATTPMSYKQRYNGVPYSNSLPRSLNDELDRIATRATSNPIEIPLNLTLHKREQRTVSAGSAPLPIGHMRLGSSPKVRWTDVSDRFDETSTASKPGRSQGSVSEHSLLMQHCHHQSINISISIPGSSSQVPRSPGPPMSPSPVPEAPQPSRFREVMAQLFQTLVLTLSQTLINVSRLVLVIILALIIGLTILGQLAVYVFPLLCVLERVLWQDDQMGFCVRVL